MTRDRTAADIAAASAALTVTELKDAGLLARSLTERQERRLARLLRQCFRGCLRAYRDRHSWPLSEPTTKP